MIYKQRKTLKKCSARVMRATEKERKVKSSDQLQEPWPKMNED